MNDLDAFRAMLSRAGVTYEVERVRTLGPLRAEETVTITIRATTDNSEAQNGYMGFWTEFTFTDDGALKSVGIWE